MATVAALAAPRVCLAHAPAALPGRRWSVTRAIPAPEGRSGFAGFMPGAPKEASPRPDERRRPRKPPRDPSVVRGTKFRAVETERKQRLNKVVAAAGYASRRKAEDIIREGRVRVNGQVVTLPQHLVDVLKDRVQVDGAAVQAQAQEFFYFAVNKPKGYICSNTRTKDAPESGARLAIDLLAPFVDEWRQSRPGAVPPRLFTVGRLDVQSTGLLLVTNDGQWAQEVSHPSSGLTKEYVVTTNPLPSASHVATMTAGCEVDGVRVVPVGVGLVGTGAERRLRVVVAEGRNREVRSLCAAAGLDVKTLRRVRVGGMRMPRELGPGQYRRLRPFEVRRVTNLGEQNQQHLSIGLDLSDVDTSDE